MAELPSRGLVLAVFRSQKDIINQIGLGLAFLLHNGPSEHLTPFRPMHHGHEGSGLQAKIRVARLAGPPPTHRMHCMPFPSQP